MTASKASQSLTEMLNLVRDGERVLLQRNKKDVAALVSMEDLALLEDLEDRMDRAAIREALKEPGSIPWEQVKADLGLS
jgi:hypothetical protein